MGLHPSNIVACAVDFLLRLKPEVSKGADCPVNICRCVPPRTACEPAVKGRVSTRHGRVTTGLVERTVSATRKISFC